MCAAPCVEPGSRRIYKLQNNTTVQLHTYSESGPPQTPTDCPVQYFQAWAECLGGATSPMCPNHKATASHQPKALCILKCQQQPRSQDLLVAIGRQQQVVEAGVRGRQPAVLGSVPEITKGGVKWPNPFMGTRSDPVMKNSSRFCCVSSRPCTTCTRSTTQHDTARHSTTEDQPLVVPLDNTCNSHTHTQDKPSSWLLNPHNQPVS